MCETCSSIMRISETWGGGFDAMSRAWYDILVKEEPDDQRIALRHNVPLRAVRELRRTVSATQ